MGEFRLVFFFTRKNYLIGILLGHESKNEINLNNGYNLMVLYI